MNWVSCFNAVHVQSSLGMRHVLLCRGFNLQSWGLVPEETESTAVGAHCPEDISKGASKGSSACFPRLEQGDGWKEWKDLLVVPATAWPCEWKSLGTENTGVTAHEQPAVLPWTGSKVNFPKPWFPSVYGVTSWATIVSPDPFLLKQLRASQEDPLMCPQPKRTWTLMLTQDKSFFATLWQWWIDII